MKHWRFYLVFVGTLGVVLTSVIVVRAANSEVEQIRKIQAAVSLQNTGIISQLPVFEFKGDNEHSETNKSDNLQDFQKQTVERIRREFSNVDPINSTEISEYVIKKLVEQCSEFVYFRFVRNDPDEYLSWRLRNGYRFRDRDLVLVTWMAAYDYERLFGEECDEETPIREIFERMFRHNIAESDQPSSRAIGMGSGVDAVVVSVVREDPLVGSDALDYGSEERNLFWSGPGMGSHRCWFTRSDKVSDDTAPFYEGQVGFILEYADGTRRQVLVSAFLDDDRGASWSIEYLWTREFGGEGNLLEF